MNNLTAEQLISKTKVALMNDPYWQWTADVIMMGASTVVDGDHEVQTAATDGLNEIYHRVFVMQLPNEAQRKFLILHEAYHKLFRHLTVWEDLFKIDPQCASIACDVVVNNQCLMGKPGVEMIAGGVNMPEYADDLVWDARQIFMDLRRRGLGGGGGHDTHLWKEAQAMSDEELPHPKDIEADPKNARLPKSASARLMMVFKSIQYITSANVDAYATYFKRMPVEIVATWMKAGVSREKTKTVLLQNQQVREYAISNSWVL